MKLASPYQPRRPTETVLYRAVRQHLETFLAPLGELGLPTEAPRAARARDPTTLDGDDE